MSEEVAVKPCSVVTVPSVTHEGEGSLTSVDESHLLVHNPAVNNTNNDLGNCVPQAFFWNVEDVANWVEEIGYWQYKNCFTENFVDGRKLVMMDANSLPKIGIQDFDHIKTISKAVRNILRVEAPDSKRTIYLPPRDHLATYLEKKAFRGPHSDGMEFEPL